MRDQRRARREKLHAVALAAAIGLEDDRAFAELVRCFDDRIVADRGDRARRADAGGVEGGILRGLADLEPQGAAVIDDAAAVALQPGEHDGGVFRPEAVVARVRGSAHAVVEHALGWRRGEVDRALGQEPLLVGDLLCGKGGTERFNPDIVLVQNVDARHIYTHQLYNLLNILFNCVYCQVALRPYCSASHAGGRGRERHTQASPPNRRAVDRPDPRARRHRPVSRHHRGARAGAADHRDAGLLAARGGSRPRRLRRPAGAPPLQPDRQRAWRLRRDPARFRR